MSHKIPTTIIPSENLTRFVINTDAGSISVSGAFFLLGDDIVCSTFATGSSVYVTGTATGISLIVQADVGQAAPSNGVLNFFTALSDENAKFFTIFATGNTIDLISTIVPASLGGTGNTSLTQDSLLYGEGVFPTGFIMTGTNGQLLLGALGFPPAFETITSLGGTLTFTMGPHSLNIDIDLAKITFFNLIPVGGGGTGRTLLTTHGVLIGEGSLPVNVTAPGTNGQLLLSSSSGDPQFATVTSTGNTLTFTFGPNSLNIDVNVSGITLFNLFSPEVGGTGRTLLTTYGVLIGEDLQNVNVTDPGTNGQVLLAATGADPAFSTLTSSGGTITFVLGPNALNIDINPAGITFAIVILPVNLGGTGQTVLTSYGVLIGEGSLGVHVTAPGTDGQAFIASTIGDPAFATITSTGGTMTFTFGHQSLNMDINFNSSFFSQTPVGNGGLGQTLLTTFGVLIGEGSLGVHSSAPGTDGQAFLASSTGDPAFQTITSTGGTLTFSFGHNSLNIDINFNSTFFQFIPPTSGGTGRTLLTSFGVLIGEGSLPVNVTPAGTDGQVLLASTTGDPLFARITSTGGTLTFTVGHNSLNIDVNVNGITFFDVLQVENGGTGRTLLTAHGVLIGEGTADIHVTAAGTDGQALIGATGADPKFGTISSTGGTLSLTFGANSLNIDVALTKELTVFADSGTATPSGGFLHVIGAGVITTISSGADLLIQLNTANSFFNPLQPGNGGTGRTVLTTNGVLIGEGSLPINVTAAGTNGQLLLAATGADPQFATLTSSGGTLSFTRGINTLNININPSKITFPFPMPIGNGGTGHSLLTTYGVLIGEGSLPVHVTAAGTNGQTLIASTGADPQFATITSSSGTLTFAKGPNALNIDVTLAGLTIPSPLPVTQGGTGRTVLTTFGVLLGEGSNRVNVTAPGTDGQALIAATGADPKFSTITSTGNTLTFSFGANAVNIDINLFGNTNFNPFQVRNGGLGRTVFTTYGVLIGEGSNSVNVTAAGTDGQTLVGATNLDPKFVTLTSTGGTLTFSFGPNALNIEINALSTQFSPFPPTNGSTGQTILTTYGILIGEGSRDVNVTAAGTDGQALIAGTNLDPIFATITSTGGTIAFTAGPNALTIDVNLFSSTFTLFPVNNGGTGQTILTTYGILIGEGSRDVNVTDAGTDGQVLIAGTNLDPKFATLSSTGNSITFSFGPNALNLEVNISGYFGPLPVTRGGTGTTAFTPYAVICGGTTSTSSWQSIASVGNAGDILTSNGPNALPSFQTFTATASFSQINVLTFTSLSFYTPSINMLYCTIECVGGGGGGGGATSSTAAYGVGGGGGGGGYARKTFPAASISGAQLILIGAGGTAGTDQGTAGGSGGNTSVGALLSATGGLGGASGSSAGTDTGTSALGGNGGIGSLGDINAAGQAGFGGIAIAEDPNEYLFTISGGGGQSYFQMGAQQVGVFTNDPFSPTASAGINGFSNGAGGSGAASVFGSIGQPGGAGAAGTVVVTEYI